MLYSLFVSLSLLLCFCFLFVCLCIFVLLCFYLYWFCFPVLIVCFLWRTCLQCVWFQGDVNVISRWRQRAFYGYSPPPHGTRQRLLIAYVPYSFEHSVDGHSFHTRLVLNHRKVKGCRMGRSDKVSLWCVSLLINNRFRFFYFRISNC